MSIRRGSLDQDITVGKMGADSGMGTRAYRGSNIPQFSQVVFQQNFYDNSTSPQVGSATYTRSGSLVNWTTPTTVSEFSANNLPIGVVRYNGTETLKGAYFGGAITNFLVRSEEFDNASWTAVGGGSASSNTAVDPLGTSTADTISGSSSGDGLAQDSGVTAGTNRSYVFSVFLKTSSSTATVRIVVKDAGTEQGFVECPVTTTWRRFEVPHKFNTPTGNVSVQILVGNTSNVRAWGAQLEDFTTASAGRRDRYASANAYIRTTSSTATSGDSRYEIPNSVLSQLTTKGSFSAWIYVSWDCGEVIDGTAMTIFSSNAEMFMLAIRPIEGPTFWFNSSAVIPTANCIRVLGVDSWTHIACTWDADADIYKIYLNSDEVVSSTSARSPFTAGANTINLGGYDSALSHFGMDGIISQAIFWKTPLTASEISSIYQNKYSIARRAAPGTGKIFSISLGTSIVPTVGDTEYHYNHRGFGSLGYYNATTTYSVAAQNAYPSPAFPLGGFNKGGMAFHGALQNEILQSEAPATTWTSVGSPSSINNAVGTFLGSISYGTIVAAGAGDGIEQSSTITAVSKKFVGSVFAATGSGTLGFTITIAGDSGGTPESQTSGTFTATTTPQRFDFFHTGFTGSATGNAKIRILTTAAGTLRIGGMMFQRVDAASNSYLEVGSPYIKTTTAVSSVGSNLIYYRASDSINYNQGTATAWAYLFTDPGTEFISGNGPTLIGAPGQYANFYWHVLDTLYRFNYSGVSLTNNGFSNIKNRWTHFSCTWFVSGTTITLITYRDGVLMESGSGTISEPLNHRKIIVGGDFLHIPLDYWQGGIDTIDIYGSVFTDQQILDDFNNTKAAYGR